MKLALLILKWKMDTCSQPLSKTLGSRCISKVEIFTHYEINPVYILQVLKQPCEVSGSPL